MERTGKGIQDQVECSTCPGSPGWKACGPEEIQEHWSPVPQLQGVLSIVMLALVDRQYKFRWVDAGTVGSCSDGQIFNACQLKRNIEHGRIDFPDPAPITQGGRDVAYFILADDAFALKTCLMNPYGRRMLTREEKIANYRNQGAGEDVNQRRKDCQLQKSRGRRVLKMLLASWSQDSE